jgi:hypothetical protein
VERFDVAVRRYLAARCWASWVFHEVHGVRSAVRWVQFVRETLLVELCRGSAGAPDDGASLRDAIGRSDHLLVHLASPQRLVRTLNASEDTALTVSPLRVPTSNGPGARARASRSARGTDPGRRRSTGR